LDYRILGPLEVSANGELIDIGPKQQRTLLGLLLVNANRVVSTERILEELWPDDAVGKEKTLWVYISRLRSALEPDRPARARSSVLVTKDHGYTLLVDAADIDGSRFEKAAQAGSALIRDEPRAAATLLREGLDLWRGEALEDFAYDDFSQMEITRLEELRRSTIEDRIDADIRSGHHREVTSELAAFAGQNPMRERPVALLMLALYRSGRQAEALRTFETHRRTIGEELGIEPSAELRRLEEQVLLQDPRLERIAGSSDEVARVGDVRSPFKGLQAFAESDVEVFFGRDRLTSELVRRLNSDTRFLALVGASGSGKSSVVRAGLIPALRKGAVPGSDGWLVAQMVPGSRPFTELEAAMLRSTLDSPDSLTDLLDDSEDGLLRTALRLLPRGEGRLVLFIDQFEELFTLVDSEDVRSRFIRNLEVALDDSHGRVAVVLALRADFYHLPLQYSHFAELLGNAVVNTVPLTPDELEAAAEEPAAIAGVYLQPALLGRLLADVAGQSGGLPLFQYALTELFDRRSDELLTAASYQEMGGVQGAISRRAEELYVAMDAAGQEAAKQLFLRLVTITESDAWSRRRVAAAEILALDIDVVAVQSVLDRFGSYRLLTFDRDHVTGSPTVEVAHEALLHEWARLRDWIDESRDDVLRHARLTVAIDEWTAAGEKPDYLLNGDRLQRYEEWSRVSTLTLSTDEQRFIDASLDHSEDQRRVVAKQAAQVSRLSRQARARLWGLAAAVVVLVAVGIGLFVAALGGDAPRIAIVHSGAGDRGMNDLMIDGLAAADREFDIEAEEVVPLVDPAGDIRHLAETGTNLIIVSTEYDRFVGPIAADYPDVRFAAIDPFAQHTELDNIANVEFAVADSAFLAGAAAGLVSKTGIVGFIGGVQVPPTEASRTGFEEGALLLTPDTEVLSRYIGPIENPLATATAQRELAHDLAVELFATGTDVIFVVAGGSGAGVIDAAVELSTPSRQLWVIGSDIDEYQTVSTIDQAHVLTSATKRYDIAVAGVIRSFLDGGFTPGVTTMSLADEGVALSRTGGHLDEVSGQLANLEGDVAFGHIFVPSLAERSPQWQRPPDHLWRITNDGHRCTIEGSLQPSEQSVVSVEPGRIVEVEYINLTDVVAGIAVRGISAEVTLQQLVTEAQAGIPQSFDTVVAASLVAPGATTSVAMVMTQATVVPNCFLPTSDETPSDFFTIVLAPGAQGE